jgi:CubicO group peptidase (beta-lactamase class C family)
MINLPKLSLLFFVPAMFTMQTANAQSTKAVKIDSFIREANKSGLFSGNIEVRDYHKVIYKKSIGFTDASKRVKLTDQYRFHIGSIAKEFPAVAIMMLKEQGKLSLDDKVSKYITDLPAWANEISIKNLLQYTSGLPDLKWKTVNGDDSNWQDLKKLDTLNAVPGTAYAYNNNNNFLQKAIIAKISGMTFKEFTEQKILRPCGMSASVVDPTDQDTLMAKSYDNSGKQEALIYPITGWTAVTINDFLKWSDALASFKLISPASTLQILTPVSGEDKQAGLGHGTMNKNVLKTHIHDGIAQKYQALLDADFSKGRTVILMTNNRQNNVYQLNDIIQAILDGKTHQSLADLMAGSKK